jgi:hypothetical protein
MDRRNAIVSQNTKFGIYNVRIITYTILSSFRNAPVYRGNDPQIQQHTAVNFLDKLIRKLTQTANNMTDDARRADLSTCVSNFRLIHSENPYHLYVHLLNALQFEYQLTPNLPNAIIDQLMPNNFLITSNLNYCEKRLESNKNDKQKLQQQYKQMCLESTINNVPLDTTYVLNQLTRKLVALVENFRQVIALIQQIQTELLDTYLHEWKKNQKLAGNGSMKVISLDTIQRWCERLAKIILDTNEQMRLISNDNILSITDEQTGLIYDWFTNLNSELITLWTSLVKKTCIVEKQPPQVLKIGTKFESTVRWLLANALKERMNVEVKVMIFAGN